MPKKKKAKSKKSASKKKQAKKQLKKKPVEKKFQINIRQSSGDLVQIQIAARLHKVPKGFKITRELLSAFIRKKASESRGQWKQKAGVVEGAKEGANPPGIELRIIRWRNPDRKSRGLRTWRYGTQADAWGSLWRVLLLIGL